MKQDIKNFEGCYNVRQGTEPDILIRFGLSPYPNINQIADIVSIHGQKRKSVKSIGLSLKQVVELRDALQNVIDNSPIILSKQ